MEDDELIYKKLSGELTTDEELLFEHRQAVDPAFVEEYAFQRAAVESLAQPDAVMKGKLRRAYRAVQERKQRRRTRGRWAVAATVALLVGVGGWFFFVRPSAEPYVSYYLPYQPYPEMRGNAVAERFAEALPPYRRGDYAAAATLFEELPPGDERDLYLGNCYWQLGEVATAQRYFEQAYASDNPIRRQHAEWYLVLCALRQENRDRVDKLLTTVLERQGLYYKEAQQLQGELLSGGG